MKVTTTNARTILPDLIKRAEQGETIEFTTYGSTKAVLISSERYERLSRNMHKNN